MNRDTTCYGPELFRSGVVTPARFSSGFGMGFGWVSVGFSWVLHGYHTDFFHKQQKNFIGWDTKANPASSQELGMGFGGFCVGLASHPRSRQH